VSAPPSGKSGGGVAILSTCAIRLGNVAFKHENFAKIIMRLRQLRRLSEDASQNESWDAVSLATLPKANTQIDVSIDVAGFLVQESVDMSPIGLFWRPFFSKKNGNSIVRLRRLGARRIAAFTFGSRLIMCDPVGPKVGVAE